MSFIGSFIIMLVNVLTFAIFIRVLLSWVDPQGGWPVTRILHEVTEPVLGPIRSVMPSVGMFDFSPMVAILLLQVIGMAVAQAFAGA